MSSVMVDMEDGIEWLKNRLDERFKHGTEEDILFLKAVIKYAWGMDTEEGVNQQLKKKPSSICVKNSSG
ncbi:unnamed protein product [marine sediment metagenome]|uniref:Uncharacterized protein n=1 Tax=marine sediment metagenome TaxID=412755 RepID=X1MXC1_9ZZZZ